MTLVDNRNTSNPFINLAIEEFLVRSADCIKEDFLFLYINQPCIVIGKNQSIYQEVNFEFLRNGKLKLCRRISGGGTVYQDSGNLNFAFVQKFSEEKINNYKSFNQPLIDVLKKISVNVEMDLRNNILYNGKKISGNAQFTNRKNIISHGTLLFNADLEILRTSLAENDFEIETKAVSSVRSSVINIADVTNKIPSAEELKTFLAQELTNGTAFQFSKKDWVSIQKNADQKFQSYDWIYGRSPRTKIKKENLEIEIADGLIFKIGSSQFAIPNLSGVRYEYSAIKKALENSSNASEILNAIF